MARALDLIHARFAEPLTVDQLAREAGVSRTVLGEQFVRVVGELPMRYAGRWRLKVAAGRLSSTRERSSAIGFAVGFSSEEAFSRAFRREYGLPPSSWRRQSAMAAGRLPDQIIHTARAADGTGLAWSEAGSGPPLVKTANWLNHLSFDWESPVWRHWLVELTQENRLIRYDERGNGLSDWDVERLDFEIVRRRHGDRRRSGGRRNVRPVRDLARRRGRHRLQPSPSGPSAADDSAGGLRAGLGPEAQG